MMVRINKVQARIVAETLERAPASAEFALEQTPKGLVLWDREPGDQFRIRISRNGSIYPRPASRALREYESR